MQMQSRSAALRIPRCLAACPAYCKTQVAPLEHGYEKSVQSSQSCLAEGFCTIVSRQSCRHVMDTILQSICFGEAGESSPCGSRIARAGMRQGLNDALCYICGVLRLIQLMFIIRGDEIMVYQAAGTRYDAMKYRRTGRSGLLLPAISIGIWWNFGGVDTHRKRARHAADGIRPRHHTYRHRQ